MLNEWITITGKLKYSPKRPGIKKTARDTDSWLILEVPNGISEYYCFWFQKVYGIRLQRPAWGTHITILDGRKNIPDNVSHLWKKYDGELIQIEYSVRMEQHWRFIVLPVKENSRFLEIRNELGFRNSFDPHITIGRIDENISL